MSEPLYTLSYFSRNAIDNEDADELAREIKAILETARRSNARRGITGALLYSAGCFAQVLEGPLDLVEATFERIQLDPRHRDVKLLQFYPLVERSFGDWSMGFAGVDPDGPDRARVDAALAQPQSTEAEPDSLGFISVLRDLITRHELHGM